MPERLKKSGLNSLCAILERTSYQENSYIRKFINCLKHKMSLVLLRSYSKARNNVLNRGSGNSSVSHLIALFTKSYSDDKDNSPEFINSTILIENGYSVHELPLVVRKIKDLNTLQNAGTTDTPKNTNESLNYHLIQEEFKQCVDLRDVFSLITKCTKITPNIALGAIERIYDLEKNANNSIVRSQSIHINFAKGAILDKLLKVVMKTEDTQTILNILKTNSSLMEPFKYKFCDELLLRVIDNKLTLEQLCDFSMFLTGNNSEQKYSDTADRLWVGFIEKEGDINEINIVQIFNILPGLKVSKKTLLTLLEQKLADIWYKIKAPAMQDILSTITAEKYFSLQSFPILSRWLYTNIHMLHEDELLDILTKFTRLKYSDDQIEAAVEKYMKLKGTRVSSYVFIVGVLNYCMQFQLRNRHILDACSKYFIVNKNNVPSSFLKSFLYPYGYLQSEPVNSSEFWLLVEEELLERYHKMMIDDLCHIVLSYIYSGYYPLKLVSKMLSLEYIAKLNNQDVYKKLQLLDTSLSIECNEYTGPLLPKDQCYTSIKQDNRVKNIITKIESNFIKVAGSSSIISTGVLIPHYCPNETYMIDVMVIPAALSNSFSWKSKSDRSNIVAILIHLPDHFCSTGDHLIGPQEMRKRQLKILGMKVVSLNYSLLSEFYTSHNTNGLEKYLQDSIKNAEPCI